MSTIRWANSVKKFQAAGIHPSNFLPIAPVGAVIGKNTGIDPKSLGKTPGRFHERTRTWSGLGGRAIAEGITRAQFEEFADWPTPNVGLLGRAYPGIDSDALTDEARIYVEEIIYKAFGKDTTFAERIRGAGPRRLYAFKGQGIKTRHLTYRMPGDATDHKLDIIGHGGQYVITGTHPSGDEYKWHPDADLSKIADTITEISQEDMDRFLTLFQDTLRNRGGEIVRSTGGGGAGDELDITSLEPVMPVETVLKGLNQLPNTPETFLHRDDLVSALAAIRAALGRESLNREVENAVFEWATQDPEWCPEDYFDKIWRSLDRVRVGRDSLDRLFRRNGISSHVGAVFSDDTKSVSAAITSHKSDNRDKKAVLLDTTANRYIFGFVNTRQGQAKITMRDRWNVDQEWPGYDWWRMELPESDRALVGDLHDIDGYAKNKEGFANFLRDLQNSHKDIWYSGEARHPAYDKGEIVAEEQPDGNIRRLVNMRYLSPAIRHARKPDPDPSRSQSDVRHILDFVRRLFGEDMVGYELDTLAYMAQSGDRPGSMLFLVGESGVGKSVWMNLLSALFDGTGPDASGALDGSKLQNENARRFMFAKVEGCRILSVRELPEGSGSRDMATITALLKQMVDSGPEGDYVTVEAKGENARQAKNFSRVVISSNYANAIHVEQHDRRIFYVHAKINIETKPDEHYYAKLVEITQDPARLAAFWRYLLTREIGKYSRYTPPPVSTEKAERIVAEIEQAFVRHSRAAIKLLKASKRMMFDTEEFAELLTLMSEREHLNSGGEVAKVTYKRSEENGKSSPAFMGAIRAIKKSDALKFERDFRTASTRPPQIYILSEFAELSVKLMELDRRDVFDMLHGDMEQSYAPHPWKMYQKPERQSDEE